MDLLDLWNLLKILKNSGEVFIDYLSTYLFLAFFLSLLGVWEDGVLAVPTEVAGDLRSEESAVAAVAESDGTGWDPTGCCWISC